MGLKKMYNLKTKKEFDKFFGNSKNWKHKYFNNGICNYLEIDYRKDAKKLIKSIQKPTGSEGNMEATICYYDEAYKNWHHDGTWSKTQDYNPKTGELIPFEHSIDKEEFERGGWKIVCFQSRGERFVISTFGNLRDRSIDDFKKEFEKYIKQLEDYFEIDGVNVTVQDSWSGDMYYFSYDEILKATKITGEEYIKWQSAKKIRRTNRARGYCMACI
jgi:hypothetical protein